MTRDPLSDRRSRREKAPLPRVIVAGPDVEAGRLLSEALERGGFDPHRTPTPEATTLAVSYRSPAAVLLDGSFLVSTGFRILDHVRMCAASLPVLVIADPGMEDLRVRALAQGVEDCLTRPFAEQEAVIRVRRALDRRRVEGRLRDQVEDAGGSVEDLRRELHQLRTQLRKTVTMLQSAVDFHQRLEPGDAQAFRDAFLRHLSAQLGVDRLAFLAPAHPDASWATVRSTWGVPSALGDRLRLQCRGELARLLAGTGAPAVMERLHGVPGLRIELGILASAGFTAILPLLLKGIPLGFVLLGEAKGGGTPTEETLTRGQFLASALVPALAAQDRWARDRHLTADTLGLLVTRLEARGGPYLRGHSLQVARVAEEMGRRLGLAGPELSRLAVAALLHDIGYFEVDVAFWTQSRALRGPDWDAIRRHPAEGVKLLGDASWGRDVTEAVHHHHERWDGTGYPDRLRGEAIPWTARILAIADAYAALTSDRVHRPAFSVEEAERVIREEAGVRFDPLLVDAVLKTPAPLEA